MEERFLVIHGENFFARAFAEIGLGRAAGGGGNRFKPCRVGGGGQLDGEGRAFAGLAGGDDVSAVFTDDAVAQAQAEAGALADFLGGEERIENALEIFGRNAGAIVVDGDAHGGSIARGGDGDAARTLMRFDGLARVVDDVEHDLLDLVSVGQHERQLLGKMRDDLHVAGAERVGNHLQNVLDELVHGDGLAFRLLAARETQERLHDFRAAFGGLEDHVEMAAVLVAHVGVLEHFGKAHDGGQRVVQFMRDARDELADGGKFFTLDQLPLRSLERLDGLLQFRLRQLDVFRHLVERVRQLAKFIPGADVHAMGKIAAPDRLGGVMQVAQRLRGLVDEEQHEGRTDQDADDDRREQQPLRLHRAGRRIAPAEQQVAGRAVIYGRGKISRRAEKMFLADGHLGHAVRTGGGKLAKHGFKLRLVRAVRKSRGGHAAIGDQHGRFFGEVAVFLRGLVIHLLAERQRAALVVLRVVDRHGDEVVKPAIHHRHVVHLPAFAAGLD